VADDERAGPSPSGVVMATPAVEGDDASSDPSLAVSGSGGSAAGRGGSGFGGKDAGGSGAVVTKSGAGSGIGGRKAAAGGVVDGGDRDGGSSGAQAAGGAASVAVAGAAAGARAAAGAGAGAGDGLDEGGAAVIAGGPSAALDGGADAALPGPPPLPTAADIERFRTLVAELRTSKGTIVLGFLPGAAPYTVQNFVVLARRGFYDGTVFHRIIPGYIAQGGDPDGTGHGGPGYMIKGEFSDVRHERGVVSMARLTHPDTAGSQFFICLDAAPHLDGSYAVFGRVLHGFEALDRIEAAGSRGGAPSEPVTLTRVVIRERTSTEAQTASNDP
jgi:peptidyl-prolyl cis-trans isomerase B (cyclophilin B)